MCILISSLEVGMHISAKIIADSWPAWADPDEKKYRITTMELTYPRFIHSEFMTHRKFSRNASSSRAITAKKLRKQVWNDPAMPVFWGAEKPGMQAGAELTGWRLAAVKQLWKLAARGACIASWGFEKLGLHKQIANRPLEPWMWMKVIVTSTEWNHFFKLRRAEDAQPEIKVLADTMYEALKASKPRHIKTGYWHLPYVSDYERVNLSTETCKKLSVARCARVSYLNHDGTSPTIEKDIKLHNMLQKAPHASPFEHQATPAFGHHANFSGWRQYRSEIPNEYMPEVL